MATNRRISEFPEIAGTTIDEPDLLTLVHVFEVDPVLRNKKITLSGFKDYLNQYYIQGSGNLFNGDLVIGENLIVSGTTTLIGATTANQITVSGLGTFSGIFVQNNLEAVGTISGITVTGNNGQFGNLTAVSGTFVNRISGSTITGNNLQATNITGANGVFSSFTGTVIQGTSITGVSGVFTGQVSGTTFTGETANFTDITGSTLAITTPSGVSPAIVCSGVVSGGTSGFVIQGPLVILA